MIDWYELGRKAATAGTAQPNAAFAIDIAGRWTPGMNMDELKAEWLRGYNSIGIVIDVTACPRCEQNHNQLLFKETAINALGNHYVAACPVKGLPILSEEIS